MNADQFESLDEAGSRGEARQSRARFLRQLGVTLAAGIGAIALPSLSGAAQARPNFQYQCCPNSHLCSCPPGKQPFFCVCPNGNFCTCNYTGNECTNCIE